MSLNTPNILCISLTPALDHYVTVKKFEFGKLNRTLSALERAGGKSINGARAISQLGGKPLVISVLGGFRGRAITDYAHQEDIDLLSIRTESETRQYIEIWDETSQASTHISEQWSEVTPQEWIAYNKLITEQARNNTKLDAAVISGGMPPGVDNKEIIHLVKILRDAGIPCFVDSEGETLAHLLTAKPDIVKINNHEASNYLGEYIESIQDAVKACKHIVARGTESCVITMGDQGAVGATKSEIYHVNINNKGLWPVGSGDSFLGAMAVKWVEGEPWLNIMISGAAAGTANAHRRISGLLDMKIYKLGLETAHFTQYSW